MNISTAFNCIESVAFDATAGLAGGYQSFCRIVSEDEAFRALIDRSQQAPEVEEMASARVAALATRSIDPDYLNPFDTALATYLHFLSLIRIEVAQITALAVLDAKNCYWARITAQHLLSFAKVVDVKSQPLLSGDP